VIQKLTPKEEAVLELIAKDKIAAIYFFKKVSDPKWLPHLKEKGFFSPEKAPGPEPADKEGFYTIPHWNVLDYLERVSQKVKEPGNEIYIDKLLEIVKEVTKYHRETNKLDNYHIWGSFIRILSNLPNNKISMEIIDLIPVWLDSRFNTGLQTIEIIEKLFPKFLTDNPNDIQKAEQIISYLTEIKEKDKKKLLKTDIYLLKKFFEKHLNTIAEKCSIKLIVKRIKELTSTEYEGTLHSLCDYEEANYLLKRPVELFTYILSKILLIKIKRNPQNVNRILESFFKESHPIFTKIALFVIGQNIDTFKDLFWKVFKDKGEKFLEGAILYWGDELKKVLESLGPLDNNQRKLLKEKIEIATKNYAETLKEKIEKEKEKRKAAFKQRIYKALSYDDEFKALYDAIKQRTGMDAELSPAIGKIETRTGWGKPPLSVEKILEMNNEKLAEYLTKFKTVDFWEGPTVEALAETLKTAVKTNPQKFTENLESFLKVDYLYMTRILEGLREALTESKPIKYEKTLNFVETYINRDEFWQDKLKVRSSLPETHTGVISAFCFFITEGFQNEAHPVPEELFEKVEHIIHLILKKLEIEKPDKEISDHILYSFNTPLGRVIETYIKFVLEVFQSSHSKKEFMIKKFIEQYKQFLANSIIEAYTFLGMYLLNFYFHINKCFTIETVKSLKKRGKTWEAFMEGYFVIGRIHKEVYKFMKEHYEASLDYKFKNRSSKEKLIEHLSLAYLIDLESLEPSSLFYKLIEKFNSDHINQIIWFFWTQRDYLREDNERNRQIKKRILDFWQFVYDKLKDKHLSEEEKEILSNIVELTVFLPELAKPYIDWLKFSAQFIKDSVTFSFFLDYLEKFMEIGDRIQTAKTIGEILLKAPVFTYPKDKIKSFIKYLCETDDGEVKKIAKDICEKYIKSGIFFLKEICEKCN